MILKLRHLKQQSKAEKKNPKFFLKITTKTTRTKKQF